MGWRLNTHLLYFPFTIISSSLFIGCTPLEFKTSDNPFLENGSSIVDGKLGAFKQRDTGDCFFLASLIAIAEDADGEQLIELSFKDNGLIVFPNLHEYPAVITQQEMATYKLIGSEGKNYSKPVSGDPDIKTLEIAADKIWKKRGHLNGLWDDVPMNAVFMFTNTKQMLIWNKSEVDANSLEDIEKYQRLPEGVVTENNVSTKAEIMACLRNIVMADKDGISMILIDYMMYHAVAIVNIDFSKNTYKTIDTHSSILIEERLDSLVDGIKKGQYVINYVEIQEI